MALTKKCSIECRLFVKDSSKIDRCQTKSGSRSVSIGDDCRFGYELSDGREEKYLDARGFPLRKGFYHWGDDKFNIHYIQKKSGRWMCYSPDSVPHPLNSEVAKQHFFPSDLLPETLEREYRKNADFVKVMSKQLNKVKSNKK
jgi:hypothetical protein